ncbi:MAG: acyl-CoA dehydrogenase family protein [Acidimicrobiia bacterium]|nr:acyl-CoA dehydrogenase family protein [Acidimicrobiia bacterium]
MQPWQDPELDQIRDETRAWALETFGDGGSERDRVGHSYDPVAWKAIAERGLLGICMPEEFGGQGRPVTHAVAAFEGLGHGSRDSGLVYAAISQVFGIQMTLALLGSDELKRRYLPGSVAGDVTLVHGFTEEGGGSDAFGMSAAARKEGESWILSGTKTFITNGPNADVAMVWAKTGEGRSPFALSCFIVDMAWDGASLGRTFEKVALRTVHMGELVFDEVVVPASHILGRKGGGLRALTESTGWERAVLLTSALGPMARVLDEVIDWSKDREAYGKPIGNYQQVSSKVADMIMRYKLSRMVIYDMAARLGHGESIQPWMQDAAIAKLFVSENYLPFMMDAVQTFGVRGILYDFPVQQDLRDAIPSTIYVGTSESMRNTIAKLAGVPVE